MQQNGWTAAIWRGIVRAMWAAREGARTAWRIVKPPLLGALQVIAALIVLFEEWGWKPLSELLGRLARFAPIALIERWIATLPPYGALLVFAAPTALLLPLKFLAMWLLANGKVWTATGLFAGAKVASTALVARLFTLTKPALMRIEWFARAYNWFVPWKDALFAQLRASWAWRFGRILKERIKRRGAVILARLKVWAADLQVEVRLAALAKSGRRAVAKLRALAGGR